MVQRTVLKVYITCHKCKKQLLKAVSGLEGIDKVEIDGAKSTLTVTGNADPYEIIVRIKRTKKFVEIVSIGPPPAPPKPDAGGGGGGAQKKPDDKKSADDKKPAQDQKKSIDPIIMPQLPYYMHQGCPVCERMNYNMGYKSNDPSVNCSIL